MTIDELKVAIERRGYRVELIDEREELIILILYQGEGKHFAGWSALEAPRLLHCQSAASYQGSFRDYVEQVVLRPVLTQGHEYKWCIRCHEPLLFQRRTRPVGIIQVTATDDLMEYYQTSGLYRSAKAGPDSPALLSCPRCQSLLLDSTTEDIRD